MSTTKHIRDISSLTGLGVTLQSLPEDVMIDDDDDNNKDNQCPSQSQLENILKENDFGNEEKIAARYKEYIDQEEYEKDGLLEDLRDEDGSWLVDSELKAFFEWNDDQTNRFKQLLLQLMEEKQQQVTLRKKHQSRFKSILTKTKSKAFLGALKKTATLQPQKNEHQTSMPTYINRAIWFRSDDENLERLIDKAVKEVLNIDSIWQNPQFVKNIYSNQHFSSCIDQIFKLKFKFFERFVTDRYKRQLQLHALQTEKAELNIQNKDDDDDDHDSKHNNNNKKGKSHNEDKTANYVVYYAIKEKFDDDDDLEFEEEEDEDKEEKMEAKKEEEKDLEEDGGDDNIYEYHVFPQSMEDRIKEKEKYKGKICDICLDKTRDNDFEWSWWKRKTKGEACKKAKQNGVKSYGFWEMLNNEKIKTQNIEKNGVSIDHLNIIFELLRHYYAKSIKMKAMSERISQSKQSLQIQLKAFSSAYDPTILKVVYCQGDFIPIKFDVDIYIHEIRIESTATLNKTTSDNNNNNKQTTSLIKDQESKSEKLTQLTQISSLNRASSEVIDNLQNVSLYALTWWNGKKRTDCNAISIKNKTAILDDDDIDTTNIKEKYYMRFRTADLGDNDLGIIDWHWYDNDSAKYQNFKDYREFYDDQGWKEHLLHKQLEAVFLSNIDDNFPWKLFDIIDPKLPKNNHSFNNAQITHLKPALLENELFFSTLGYFARFVRLYASNDAESEFDLNIILSMEQVAITNDATSFSRNIRRMKNGQNSLSFYYAGSNVFINHWLQNYLLSTKAQRLYFWSFILCICAKIKQIDIEVENQLVCIPQYEAFMSAKKADALTFDEGEVRDEQIDAVLYDGFLVPPILDGETATGASESGPKTVRGLKQKVNDLSKTRILRKAIVKKQQLKIVGQEEPEKYVWYQSLDGEQYRNSLGVMFRFGEIIRKFILETRHLGQDTSSLWPYYKNYFHRNNHQSYHTLINRFNLSLLFNRSDMFELLEQESIIDFNNNTTTKIDCFNHFSCAKLKEQVLLKESARMKSKEIAIRHKRKFAAQLLLQKWDSLRNLNILRHQLGPLLDVILEKEEKKIDNENNNDKDEKEQGLELMMEKQNRQSKLIKIAQQYDLEKWKKIIKITNERLQNNLNNTRSGWQLLTDYDIHTVDSISIEAKENPFFESFMNHFVLKDIAKELKKSKEQLQYTENTWYPLFEQSWIIVPEWWSSNHDIVLIELALKYGDNWYNYGQELTGERASDYMMRLRASGDNSLGTYVPGHSLHFSEKDMFNKNGKTTKDELRPYLEFQHWLRQKSNILHRLKYVTNKIVQNLNKIKPSLVSIRIPKEADQPKFSSSSLVFSQYERDKHLTYVEREKHLTKVDNYATEWTLQVMKTARGTKRSTTAITPTTTTRQSRTVSDEARRRKKRKRRKRWEKNAEHISADLTNIAKNFHKEEKKRQEYLGNNDDDNIQKKVSFGMTLNTQTTFTTETMTEEEFKQSRDTTRSQSGVPSYDKRQSVAVSRLFNDESESDSSNQEFEEEDENVSDEDHLEIRIHDPFVHRDLHEELREIIHAFDMIKYGPYMARFIINEIREYNMEELWDALAVVMEAMPFPMGLDILNEQMITLRRSKPDQVFKVCKEMVVGTNFGVAAALRMSDYFEKVANSDNFQYEIWKEKSVQFEKMAHELINNIESDHLLYILLTIPLYDTSESMSILSLALEQSRVSFLNNDRILGIMRHVWYNSTAIHVEETIDTKDKKWGEQFQTLFFQPFKFYMSPVGFNWTIAMLYFLYLAYVLFYSYLIVKDRDSYIGDIVLWLFNAGFVMYEISEFSDKGRQYFSVTGIMNVWDILISIIWILLFVLYIGGQVRNLVIGLEGFEDDQSDIIDAGRTTTTTTTTSTQIPRIIINSTNGYPSSTSYIWNVTQTFFTSILPEDDNDGPSAIDLNDTFRQTYAFLFALQLFFLSTRFLTLFQNTKYLGSLLKIVQKMFVEIVKFLCVAAVVVGAFTFGFYFIFGLTTVNLVEYNEVDDDVTDFWPTFLFTFDEFIQGGTGPYNENGVVPTFAMFVTIFGFLILTNLLIALMTAEYENFQGVANAEVAYMWTETVYDLSHRDRLMPPPLNLIVYAFGLIIHILVWPFAICCPTRKWNLYTWFDHDTYIWLNSFYCGCNKQFRQKINESNPDKTHDLDKEGKKNKKIFARQSRKIYSDRFATFLSFSGWIYLRDHLIDGCIKKRCCPSCIDKCCLPSNKSIHKSLQELRIKKSESKNKQINFVARRGCFHRMNKYCRRCCCRDDDEEVSSLTAYHKGCYNCIKLRVKDKLADTDTTTIRGISMKQYIEIFEDKHRTKLHKEDKILLKHLTVDTLFCDKCYSPYLERDVDQTLLAPFRVLLDYVSCWVFLCTAWFPLVIFFSIMSVVEYATSTYDQQIHSKTSTEGSNSNEYEEYDREYFPLPLRQIIDHDPYNSNVNR